MTPSDPLAAKKRFLLLGIFLFVLAFIVYWIPPLLAGRYQTPCEAYFDQLAKSFLHHHLSLSQPTCRIDLINWNGKWYLPFPPLPALLMAPWIAVFGAINTVLFAAILGATNVTLVFFLLQAMAQRHWTSLAPIANFGLAICFGLGTVHWYSSTQGSVWFVAQICTVTFVALSVWAAVSSDSPILSGGALALAMLARPNIVLTYPLLLAVAIQHHLDRGVPFENKRIAQRMVRWAVLSAIPILLAAGGLFLYNALRFGNPLEFGYTMANVSPGLADALKTYGQFNPVFIVQNLKVMLFSLPVWDSVRHRVTPSDAGMAIWLTTPAFFYLFRAIRKSPVVIGGWIAVGLLLVPLLMYFNTGWSQFGYRFSLDFIVPLFVLLAAGLGSKLPRGFKLLVLASVLINLWGTAWFLNLI
jgi:hypothetical protein